MMTVKRHALAVAACEMVPVPLLDTLLQNQVRRNLVRTLAEAQGRALDVESIGALADEPLAPMQRAALWPVKKVLCKVFFPLSIGMALHAGWKTLQLADQFSESDRPG